MNIKEDAVQIMTSAKTGWGVSLSTIGTGAGTIFDYIPDDIGKFATLIGIILSCVLIRYHIRKGNQESLIRSLEIEKLERELR